MGKTLLSSAINNQFFCSDRSLSAVRISGGSFARFWVEFTDRRMAEVSASKVECGDYGRCMAVVWLGFCSPSSPISFGGGGVE